MGDSARRNIVLGGSVIVLFALAAYLYFSRAGAQAELPQEYTIDGVCLACQQEARITASFDEPAPSACPHCGERAVYPWMYCFDCKKRFIPNLEQRGSGPPRYPIVPSCRACGSRNVGQYVPEDPLQKPIGDAPLPEWPPK